LKARVIPGTTAVVGKLTHLDANTATDAQLLGQRGYLGRGRHLDAELAHAHHWAGLLALLPTPFGLALVIADDGNTRLLVHLLVLLSARHAVDSFQMSKLNRIGFDPLISRLYGNQSIVNVANHHPRPSKQNWCTDSWTQERG